MRTLFFISFICLLYIHVTVGVFAREVWDVTLPQPTSFTRSVDTVDFGVFYGGDSNAFEGGYLSPCGVDNWYASPLSALTRQIWKYRHVFGAQDDFPTQASIRRYISSVTAGGIHKLLFEGRYANDCARFVRPDIRGTLKGIKANVFYTGSDSQSFHVATSYVPGRIPFIAPLIGYSADRRAIPSIFESTSLSGKIIAVSNYRAREDSDRGKFAAWFSQVWADDPESMTQSRTIRVHLFSGLTNNMTRGFEDIGGVSFKFSFPEDSRIRTASWMRDGKKVRDIRVLPTTTEHLYRGNYDPDRSENLFCATRDGAGNPINTACEMYVRGLKKSERDTLVIEIE